MKKYLKFLFVALFATMTLSLASCKDDKDEPSGGNYNIVGTWECTEGLLVNIMEGSELYIQFQSDGTVRQVTIVPSHFPGEKPSIDKIIGKWEVKDGTLRLSGSEALTTNCKIIKVSGDYLELEMMSYVHKFIKVSDSVVDKYFK